MKIFDLIKNKTKKYLNRASAGITDENIKRNIMFFQQLQTKNTKLQNLKSYLKSHNSARLIENQIVCHLYECQIIPVEHVLKDMIDDLYIIDKKDTADKERIKIIKTFEHLLNYYEDILLNYEYILTGESANKLKEEKQR